MNVLFLCTGNSARSVMAEALINHLPESAGRFRGYSAGSDPKGAVHPLALDVLAHHGIPIAGLASKSWDRFAAAGAPRMDVIVTVCDNAAAEACPIWPGHPTTAHWGIPDPAAAEGSDAERRAAFAEAFHELRRRIEAFAALAVETLTPAALREEMNRIAGA